MDHSVLEKKIGLMGVLIAVVISLGGIVEIVPLLFATAMSTPMRPIFFSRTEWSTVFSS